jgi:hypothetical protein
VVPASSANTEKERVKGGAVIREYLLKDGALTVYKGRCPNLIRTIGAIPVDPNEPEAYDTSAEDHAVDALRFALRNRGLKGINPDMEKLPESPPDYRPSWMKQPSNRGPAGQAWG